jgi:GT2 family glycosyltransferase
LDETEEIVRVVPGPTFNQFIALYRGSVGRVLVVIPTKNRLDLLRPCIESIFATVNEEDIRVVVVDHESDDPELAEFFASEKRILVERFEGPFNYAKMNNAAVAAHGFDCKYVLLLNNDIEAIKHGWVSRLRSLAARAGSGVVGATLLYPDRTVQHSGVVVGLNGLADHAHKFTAFETGDSRNPGYIGSLVSTRDYSAVTGACMMLPASVFREVGGFDENLPVGFNDTDLCLRVRAAGYTVINDGSTVLYHHESATRVKSGQLKHPEDAELFRQRWQSTMSEGDEFYSPLLEINGTDHIVAEVWPTSIRWRTKQVKSRFS